MVESVSNGERILIMPDLSITMSFGCKVYIDTSFLVKCAIANTVLHNIDHISFSSKYLSCVFLVLN